LKQKKSNVANGVSAATSINPKAANNRRTRALQILFGDAPIVHVQGPIWEVPSETLCRRYVVNIDRLTCECLYYRTTRRVCKHMEAVRLYRSQNAVRPEGAQTFPNPHKNAPWYDRLQERQLDILTLLLRSLSGKLSREAMEGLTRDASEVTP
jgi:hypothetical protein